MKPTSSRLAIGSSSAVRQISSTAGRRGSVRNRQHGLSCNLGSVIDLGAGGARVRCRREPSGRVDLVLTDYTRPGELRARVAWCKPCGHFHFEAGLAFERLSRGMVDRINSIAFAHRFRHAG